MTGDTGQPETGEKGRDSARGLLDRAFRAYLAFAVISALVLAAGLALPPRQFIGEGARKLKEAAPLIRMFLAALFLGATITNIGIQWAATILAGRRYRRADAYPAARVVAFSQWLCLGIYGLFEAVVLYYRLGLSGDRVIFFISIAVTALAAYYFLRMPSFVHRGVFGPRGREPR